MIFNRILALVILMLIGCKNQNEPESIDKYTSILERLHNLGISAKIVEPGNATRFIEAGMLLRTWEIDFAYKSKMFSSHFGSVMLQQYLYTAKVSECDSIANRLTQISKINDIPRQALMQNRIHPRVFLCKNNQDTVFLFCAKARDTSICDSLNKHISAIFVPSDSETYKRALRQFDSLFLSFYQNASLQEVIPGYGRKNLAHPWDSLSAVDRHLYEDAILGARKKLGLRDTLLIDSLLLSAYGIPLKPPPLKETIAK